MDHQATGKEKAHVCCTHLCVCCTCVQTASSCAPLLLFKQDYTPWAQWIFKIRPTVCTLSHSFTSSPNSRLLVLLVSYLSIIRVVFVLAALTTCHMGQRNIKVFSRESLVPSFSCCSGYFTGFIAHSKGLLKIL